ncbi:MAG: bifunctional fucokinase/L-fucose-1-P-guanylyltransferase [Bacteroidales bacterium]|nr:bifunctional fucokinase/L-fucose-1-P-guanylyltransferase [Candidatus Equimonas faecalis]
MKKLLSLPPNLVESFHDLSGLSPQEYFCTCDPVGSKLGSGGGTAWLLQAAGQEGFCTAGEKRILVHAGGQSRRLPGYASSGKVLTPIPVFRWMRGQSIDQTLLDLQMPLYEAIMRKAPQSLRTLIVSGDVLLRATEPLQDIPEADVVCYGLWADPVLCSHHGNFLMRRDRPDELDFMLQKPSTEEQAALMTTHLSLMDIGVWILSDRAIDLLIRRSTDEDGNVRFYDLYSTFGYCLGNKPARKDEEIAALSVKILPLPGGEFYHFGTTPELLSSTLAIQNLVKDQRQILQRHVKRHPSLFTQNCKVANALTSENENLWIENAVLGEGWHLTRRNVITGVPANDWQVTVPEGVCIDIVPIGESQWAVRPYGWSDPFRGDVCDKDTRYLGQSFAEWAEAHGYACTPHTDIQAFALFPVADSVEEAGRWLQWMITPHPDLAAKPKAAAFLSADELSAKANLRRLFQQRRDLQRETLPRLAQNWHKSVFYQSNLKRAAAKFREYALPLPAPLPDTAPLMTRIHDAMFRHEASQETAGQERQAYDLLREGLTMDALTHKVTPRFTTHSDQIVWSRSPVRIDVAGGWTDTPPYSLYNGGDVVNLAIELNGQPPIQVYVKPCKEPVIICRSIDLGAAERIETYEELRQYHKVGSPFSIPKAALTLCGFMPGFSTTDYPTLRQQLTDMGSGIEITLMAAIPAGSGLGTSSILASTVLGALNNFCNLGWGRHDICDRTLILEQLLTTGGGWQDQYGGVFSGVKLLHTESGFNQHAVVRWIPDPIFRAPEHQPLHLLYYTGFTRTAKHILAEIVRNMFLNDSHTLMLLREMKQHATSLYEVMQRGNFTAYGQLVRKTWEQNCALDPGTNPPAVQKLCARIDDLCLGYKLPGAGGGGYLYMVAKDVEAAMRIRKMLCENPCAPTARFVDMSLSDVGLQVSRS